MVSKHTLSLLLVLMLVAACKSPADHNVDKTAIFDRIVAPHPVAGQSDPRSTRLIAHYSCELFDEDSSADLGQVVERLWWDEIEPWSKKTVEWVVTVGVLLFCPHHVERLGEGA